VIERYGRTGLVYCDFRFVFCFQDGSLWLKPPLGHGIITFRDLSAHVSPVLGPGDVAVCKTVACTVFSASGGKPLIVVFWSYSRILLKSLELASCIVLIRFLGWRCLETKWLCFEANHPFAWSLWQTVMEQWVGGLSPCFLVLDVCWVCQSTASCFSRWTRLNMLNH
jgi:hypothetical protein